jgi:hypothetical protein
MDAANGHSLIEIKGRLFRHGFPPSVDLGQRAPRGTRLNIWQGQRQEAKVMNRMLSLMAIVIAAMLTAPASAAGKVDCNLRFDLSGWSALYKTASGGGTVTCDNGQKMTVAITAKGGGLSVGKQEIKGGTGDFSGVSDIKEVLGSYAAAEAHLGAHKGGSAQVMTKGDVQLSLAGAGKGWDVGVAFGKFTISRAK